MAKVLVTGGAGFIGSHIADRICSDKFNTAIVVDINLKPNPKVKKMESSSEKIIQ